jgi:phosphate transport system substrate-binding protein
MMKNVIAITAFLAAAAVFVTGCGGSVEGEAKVKGSDTMLNLTRNWVREFEKANEGTKISVTGGGSGTGIAALMNDTTDFAMASRKIKGKEVTRCKEAGFDVKEHIVAYDGLAIVVYKSNPVNEISFDQLKRVFGEKGLDNWSDIGGPDRELQVFSRDSSSGTFEYFRKTVLGKNGKYRSDAARKQLQSNSQILDNIIKTEGGIGYVGLGYVEERKDEVKVLKVKGKGQSTAYLPGDKNYVLTRPLHFYTKGRPEGLVKAFIEFAMSEEGQKIVKEEGFLPVPK